jgi:hypothetical protein
MIDNAIDVFNTLNASVEFCDETVRHLRADMAAGRLTEGPRRRLSESDRLAFARAEQALRDALVRTRAEIEALKRFYVR